MISNKHRFHGRASLRRVFQNGSSTRGRTLLIKYTTAPNRTTTRCAVIVSKKIFKSAVKRNRVRRRIFEIVRHELNSIPVGTDIVITVLAPDVLLLSHTDLTTELTKLLSRVQLPAHSSNKMI
jgi:ribonuclease P protein component